MVKQKYMTIPELAKLLGLSRIEVYRKVKKGQIPAIKIGRNYAISDRDINYILGKEMSDKEKKRIDAAVRKTVREYGEVLKKLGKEILLFLLYFRGRRIHFLSFLFSNNRIFSWYRFRNLLCCNSLL